MKFISLILLLLLVLISWSWGDNRDNFRRQGFQYYSEWNADSTLSYLLPIYWAHPEEDSVAIAVAEASLWKKDFRTATQVITHLRNSESPEALRVKGLLFEQAGRLNEALQLYDKAIPRLLKPWGTMERRAQVLAWLGRVPEAKAQVQKVLKAKEPSEGLRIRCLLDLALWTAWDKDLSGSILLIKQALALDGKSIEALLQLGQVYEWQGNFSQAKKTYGRVLNLNDRHAEARLRLDKLQWVE
jgi:tetratricopeptide (TPR) repeat protein